jgi:hypothetical protein
MRCASKLLASMVMVTLPFTQFTRVFLMDGDELAGGRNPGLHRGCLKTQLQGLLCGLLFGNE